MFRDGANLRLFLFAVAVASAVTLAVPLILLVITWGAGGLEVSGGRLNWVAVGALAGLASATATVLGVGALAFALRELDDRAHQDRIARMPYLRIDVGFADQAFRHSGFSPLDGLYRFTLDDFGVADHREQFQGLLAEGGSGLPLILWATNLQTQPLGVAYSVVVELGIAWADEARKIDIEFSYIAPSQTTEIELLRVRHDVERLAVEVVRVNYQDVFGAQRLGETHGALKMVYDRAQGVTNERGYQLGR